MKLKNHILKCIKHTQVLTQRDSTVNRIVALNIVDESCSIFDTTYGFLSPAKCDPRNMAWVQPGVALKPRITIIKLNGIRDTQIAVTLLLVVLLLLYEGVCVILSVELLEWIRKVTFNKTDEHYLTLWKPRFKKMWRKIIPLVMLEISLFSPICIIVLGCWTFRLKLELKCIPSHSCLWGLLCTNYAISFPGSLSWS